MTEKEKATVDYSPAPTGQNQSLASKPTTIVAQTNANYNKEISKIGLTGLTEISKSGLKLINMDDVEVENINWLWYLCED